MESHSASDASDRHEGITLQGTPIVAGIAFGPAVWMQPRPDLPGPGPVVPEGERQGEFDRFLRAGEAVSARLAARADGVEGVAADLLRTSAVLVMDPAWRRAVRRHIHEGHAAGYALVQATEELAALLVAAGGVMGERAADLTDLRDRVLAELAGLPEPGLPVPAEPVVLLAEDLAPADAAELDPDRVLALVTSRGGRTGHTAIIARQLNLTCVIGTGDGLSQVPEGALVLVDGGTGTVRTAVSPETGDRLAAGQRKAPAGHWQGPGRTRDGEPVRLLASVTGVTTAQLAARGPAEGIGLYRTELSFLRAGSEPPVAVQAQVYAQVLAAFPAKPVVIRTFDAGADKPLAFAARSGDENPALGMRGLRAARDREGLLLRQLDAVAEAARQLRDRGVATEPKVMAPMVSTVAEAEWFSARCRERGLVPGAMIEVPAAALMAELLLPVLDFVSIGTNDLTQYTMAADRLSPDLVDLTDPWQPAVLRLVAHVCRVGQETGTSVGVCGESAADPLLAAVLVGLGARSLSPAATALPAVGQALSRVDLETCRRAAEAAVAATDPVTGRNLARRILADG